MISVINKDVNCHLNCIGDFDVFLAVKAALKETKRAVEKITGTPPTSVE